MEEKVGVGEQHKDIFDFVCLLLSLQIFVRAYGRQIRHAVLIKYIFVGPFMISKCQNIPLFCCFKSSANSALKYANTKVSVLIGK